MHSCIVNEPLFITHHQSCYISRWTHHQKFYFRGSQWITHHQSLFLLHPLPTWVATLQSIGAARKHSVTHRIWPMTRSRDHHHHHCYRHHDSAILFVTIYVSSCEDMAVPNGLINSAIDCSALRTALWTPGLLLSTITTTTTTTEQQYQQQHKNNNSNNTDT